MAIDPRFFGYVGYRGKLTKKDLLSSNTQYETSFIHRFVDNKDFLYQSAAIITSPLIFALIEVTAPVVLLACFLEMVYYCCTFNKENAMKSAKTFAVMLAQYTLLLPLVIAFSPLVELLHVTLSAFAPNNEISPEVIENNNVPAMVA